MTPDQRQDLDREIKNIDREWHPTNRRYVDNSFEIFIERASWVVGSLVMIGIALGLVHWLPRIIHHG